MAYAAGHLAEAGPVSFELDPASDPEIAAALAQIAAVEPALVLVFGGPGQTLETLSRALRAALPPDCALAGCSTAGEIGLTGYVSGRAVAVAFPSSSFRAASVSSRTIGRRSS